MKRAVYTRVQQIPPYWKTGFRYSVGGDLDMENIYNGLSLTSLLLLLQISKYLDSILDLQKYVYKKGNSSRFGAQIL
jgi:hypothetical protein